MSNLIDFNAFNGRDFKTVSLYYFFQPKFNQKNEEKIKMQPDFKVINHCPHFHVINIFFFVSDGGDK